MNGETSSVDRSPAASVPPPIDLAPQTAPRDWAARLSRWSDRLNPILVKETRQALKSRQFTLTFAALLLCGWGWSMLGTALVGPHSATGPSGREMFFGYYLVLAFPLLVVVPFTAFRSLVAERDDRTHELLTISTLRPRQIVTGKLGSATVQMIVYLSALAPCLAFTYLLRGIDIVSIGAVILGTVIASVVLNCAALMLASSAAERHWQVMNSVGVIAGLFATFWMACILVYEITDHGLGPIGAWFWIAFAICALLAMTYAVLAVLAAGAQLTLATDNRSTSLRIALVGQQIAFASLMLWLWLFAGDGGLEWPLLLSIGAAVHWWFCGAIMTGESNVLSARVKRGLPTSFLGRTLFTWFNPGSGTGYVFAVMNFVALELLILAIFWADPFTRYFQATGQPLSAGWLPGWDGYSAGPRRSWLGWQLRAIRLWALLVPCYLLIYLGLGRLLLGWFRRFLVPNVIFVVMVNAGLVGLGAAIPLGIHSLLQNGRLSYHPIELSNLFWTLAEIGGRSTPSPSEPLILTIVPIAALAVFLLNVPSLAREIAATRIAKPPRVLADDAEQAT